MDREKITEEIRLASEALRELPVICDAELIGDMYRCAAHFDWTFYARLYRKADTLLCYYARTECEWLMLGLFSPCQTFADTVAPKRNDYNTGKIICGIKRFPESKIADFQHVMAMEIPECRRNGFVLDGQTYFLRQYSGGKPVREIYTFSPMDYLASDESERLVTLFDMIQFDSE